MGMGIFLLPGAVRGESYRKLDKSFPPSFPAPLETKVFV